MHSSNINCASTLPNTECITLDTYGKAILIIGREDTAFYRIYKVAM